MSILRQVGHCKDAGKEQPVDMHVLTGSAAIVILINAHPVYYYWACAVGSSFLLYCCRSKSMWWISVAILRLYLSISVTDCMYVFLLDG